VKESASVEYVVPVLAALSCSNHTSKLHLVTDHLVILNNLKSRGDQ
jgi:hypothetical protein